MTGKHISMNPDWLFNEYWIKKQSLTAIAAKLDCSPQTVLNKMQKFDILTRTISEALRSSSPHWNKDWLVHQYVTLKKSVDDIAFDLGISESAVRYAMEHFHICRRIQTVALQIAWENGKFDDRQILPETMSRISKQAWASGAYNNETTRAKMSASSSGARNPNWKGGHTGDYPWTFNDEFKDKVRMRDGYACQLCAQKARSVHHINEDKSNNSLKNCIVLCRSCHMRVHWHPELLVV